MKSLFYWIIVLTFAFLGTVAAGSQAEVELVDGSRLQGEIASVKGDVYTIQGNRM